VALRLQRTLRLRDTALGGGSLAIFLRFVHLFVCALYICLFLFPYMH